MDRTPARLRRLGLRGSTDRHRDALRRRARCPGLFQNTSRRRLPREHYALDGVPKLLRGLRAATKDQFQNWRLPTVCRQTPVLELIFRCCAKAAQKFWNTIERVMFPG